MLLASSNMGSFEILWLMHGALTVLLSRAGAKAQDVVLVSPLGLLLWHGIHWMCDLVCFLFWVPRIALCVTNVETRRLERSESPLTAPAGFRSTAPRGPVLWGVAGTDVTE